MTHGTVIVIGGAEDKVRDRLILGRFIALAGGRDARIAVISTASSMGPEAGERYRAIFTELGAASVAPLHAMTRTQANDEHIARQVRDATGVFMTGGNQLRLSSTIGGTRLADAILDRFQHGAVVAGTSAGASAVSSHMIAFGASGATPKHRMAQIAAGLGLLPGVIVDQHFQQRNRLGRLLSLIAQNPSLLGLDHRRRRLRVRDRRLGDPGPSAADDQRCRPAQPARRVPLRPPASDPGQRAAPDDDPG